MKKQFSAIIIASLFAAPVFAQSSIQMYGRVDMGYSGFTNDGRGPQLAEESESRIGFQGEEDLGNGWRAFFQLENRFHLDTGLNDAPEWRDKAWVGLGNKKFGDLYMGRVYSALFNLYGGDFEAFGADTISAVPFRRALVTYNWSNAVTYQSPAFGNMVSFVGSIGPSENGGPNRWGVGALFTLGQFQANAGYQVDTTTDDQGGYATGGATADNPYKTWLMSLRYDFGFMSIVGGYAQSRSYSINDYSLQTLDGGKVKFQAWSAGLRVPVGNGAIMANYGHTSGTNINPRTAIVTDAQSDNTEPLNHVGLGYWYNLSKRTILMSNFAYEHQKEGFKNGANSSFGYQFAVRHSF